MPDTKTPTRALLIVDMLSRWDFPDADRLLPHAARIAPHIAALAARCRAGGLPVVHANDNHGQWRADPRRIVADAMAAQGPGAHITRQLAPHDTDYSVLKPKHSCFHATPLDLLLRHLGVRSLVLAGVSSDQCVLYTAADARMHNYGIAIPRDCVATQSDERNWMALRHFNQALGVSTPLSGELDLAAEDDGHR